jgi:hypothetical protein
MPIRLSSLGLNLVVPPSLTQIHSPTILQNNAPIILPTPMHTHVPMSQFPTIPQNPTIATMPLNTMHIHVQNL